MNTLSHKKGAYLKYYFFIFIFLIFTTTIQINCSQLISYICNTPEKIQRFIKTNYDPAKQSSLMGISKEEKEEFDRTSRNRTQIHQYTNYPNQT